MLIGYARVSTNEQETKLQLDALSAAGVHTVFSEKGSSVGPRPQLHKALAAMRKGGVLVVWKIDRLARSLKDLLHLLDRLRGMGCALRSLTEPIDTSSALGEFVLQMLGAVAQFERSLIRERSIAGQLAAYRRGVKLGRRHHSTTEETIQEMRLLYDTGQWTYPDIAAFFGVHASTAKRLITGRKSRVRMPVLGAYL
uniref:recombinase family protein n=1 Tax=unclassified Variovorax TaxID=663243 RepID=UPI000D38D9A7